MSHNISHKNGQAEAIYRGRRQDVWHQLGVYTGDDAVSPEQARGVVGIPVEKVEVTYNRPIGNEDTVPTVSKKAYLTVRMDTGAELAMVGPQYTVTPYTDVLVNNLLPILDAGLATIDTAFLLEGGLRGIVMLKWEMEKLGGRTREVYGREGLKPYTMFMAAHGEGVSNQARNTTIRGVCQNTVGMILSSAMYGFSVPHRTNANTMQLEKTRELFRGLIGEFEDTAAAYDLLRSTRLDKALWQELVAKVIVPELFETRNADGKLPAFTGPRGELVEQRVRDKGNKVFKLWTGGMGHTGDLSAWEAYNGLVESLDHDTDTWKGRNAENRAISLMSGPLATTRNAVLSSLLKYAKQNGKVAVTV
jgi:hypothetical protein